MKRTTLRTIIITALSLNYLLSSACQYEIQGPNRPPIANAGPDKVVLIGSKVYLDGSKSYDPDNGKLTFRWRILNAPSHSDATISQIGNYAHLIVDEKGLYVVGLVVVDVQQTKSSMDVVQIRSTPGRCLKDSACDDNDSCTTDACVGGYCEFKAIPFSDKDSDLDGMPDCHDECADDPGKVSAGMCGCGVPEVDTDSDGDCDNTDTDDDGDTWSDADEIACGNDPLDSSSTPVDTDNDGVCDALDVCFGQSDTDSDEDGTADCAETCDQDPAKTEPGVCGCARLDSDIDGDGKLDCEDVCPNDPDQWDGDPCDCDSDEDGILDCDDSCPYDPTELDPTLCSKDILNFRLLATDNTGLSTNLIGQLDGSYIDVIAPNGIDKSALITNIEISGVSVNPTSGASVDFSEGPVLFTVTAANLSSRVYIVRVLVRASNNMLSNGSFEIGNLDGWTNREPENYTRTSAEAAQGTFSLRLESSIAKTHCAFWQDVPIVPGRDYVLSASLYVTKGSTGPIVVDTNDVFDQTAQYVVTQRQAGSWRYFEGVFNAGTFSTVNIRAFAEATFVGVGYIDDISLTGVE